jgi:hypothetical protein
MITIVLFLDVIRRPFLDVSETGFCPRLQCSFATCIHTVRKHWNRLHIFISGEGMAGVYNGAMALAGMMLLGVPGDERNMVKCKERYGLINGLGRKRS